MLDEKPEKTDEELRELKRLAEAGTAYEDFPDGATWTDLDDALALEDDADAR